MKTMSTIQDIEIFDRKTLVARRARAQRAWDQHHFLHVEIADRLADRVHDINRPFQRGLVLGSHLEGVEKFLPNIELVHCNLSKDRITGHSNAVVADDELLCFADESFDLVISNLNLHSINDLPGTLIQVRRMLKPDGLFLASMFGGDTLQELRQSMMKAEMDVMGGISPRVSPTADIRDMGSLLQRAGFVMPVTDLDTITVNYQHPFKLMHDLRGMGENNVIKKRLKGFTPRGLFVAMAEHYAKDFALDDGSLPATFQIIYLAGWSPGPNQPVPKRPGSATHSLADALKDFDAKE